MMLLEPKLESLDPPKEVNKLVALLLVMEAKVEEVEEAD